MQNCFQIGANPGGCARAEMQIYPEKDVGVLAGVEPVTFHGLDCLKYFSEDRSDENVK